MELDPLKSAIDRSHEFCEQQQHLLDAGEITEVQWFANRKKHFTDHYLSGEDPRSQSGYSGDENRYAYTQTMILAAIHKSGTFIDIGCANGYLMEKLSDWLQGTAYSVTFYGLDISEKLISLAKKRLPNWTQRFTVGNALDWIPRTTFDFVCVKELGYVPNHRRKQLFLHLYRDCVSEGGRLILGPLAEDRAAAGVGTECAGWGYIPSGTVERPHQEFTQLVRRLHWFDKQ